MKRVVVVIGEVLLTVLFVTAFALLPYALLAVAGLVQ